MPRDHVNQCWSEENTTKLIALVKEGKSAGEIAKEFGNLTRNSIIGKTARLRKHLNDDNMRVGLARGRIGKGFAGGRKKSELTPEERRAAVRLRWEKWESKNGTAVMNSLRARNRALRRLEASTMMRNQIVCCESPKVIWDLVWCDCRWIVHDAESIHDRLFCANVIEPHKSYCAAHARMAHDAQPSKFDRRPGFINKWTATLTVLRGRAA